MMIWATKTYQVPDKMTQAKEEFRKLHSEVGQPRYWFLITKRRGRAIQVIVRIPEESLTRFPGFELTTSKQLPDRPALVVGDPDALKIHYPSPRPHGGRSRKA
jgi:hypothetical protein